MSCKTKNKTRIYQYIRDNKDIDLILIARALNMKVPEIIEIRKELKIEGLVDE